MSQIAFDKTQETQHFTAADGSAVERVIEIRIDPLTGRSSRLLTDPGGRFQIPDYSDAAAQTGGANCPFCPDNLHKLTPNFPAALVPDGKLRRGEVTVCPNLFPYTAHNGVVVLGGQHYRRLDEFPTALLVDGFMAAQDYVDRVQQQASTPLHPAINWNYLPASGGSILHPHLHVTLTHTASNYQRSVAERGQAHAARTGGNLLQALCDAEQAAGERWLGELGQVRWMHAFAPSSHNDFLGILQSPRISGLARADWQDLAHGLQALLAALAEQGLASFNMTLVETEDQPLHLRLVSRLAYGALNTSDINFFQLLHRDPLSVKRPEAVATLARRHVQAAVASRPG